MQGTKMKPKHYVALVVREGKLKLIVRGRKRKELALTAFVSDGTWRSVSSIENKLFILHIAIILLYEYISVYTG